MLKFLRYFNGIASARVTRPKAENFNDDDEQEFQLYYSKDSRVCTYIYIPAMYRATLHFKIAY